MARPRLHSDAAVSAGGDRRLPAFERAIALDPHNAEALHQYGWFLWTVGRDDEARRTLDRALALDPSRAITLEHIARLLAGQRRYGEALPMMDSAVALDPSQTFYRLQRSQLRLRLGDSAGARIDVAAAAGDPVFGALAGISFYNAVGDSVRARTILAAL